MAMLNKIKANKLPSHIQFDTVSPATKLLEKRRKMYEVHEAFESQKEEFKKKEEIFKAHEEVIRQKDWAIQADLINFCKFLQDNENKKNRAEKRLLDEEKAKNQKQDEIQTLQQSITELNTQQQKLEAKVSSLKKFEDFLNSVQATFPEQYIELGDILTRHKTLTDSSAKLKENDEQTELQYEDLKEKRAKFEKERNSEILQLNNDIKELQKKLEDKIGDKNNLQSSIESSSQANEKKNLTLGKILLAIDNLWDRCQDSSTTHKMGVVKDQEIKSRRKAELKEQESKLEKEKDKRKNEIEKQLRLDKFGEIQEEDDYDIKSQIGVEKLKKVMDKIQYFKNLLTKIQDQIKESKAKKQ